MISVTLIVSIISISTLYYGFIELLDSVKNSEVGHAETRPLLLQVSGITAAVACIITIFGCGIYFRLSRTYSQQIEQQAESFLTIANAAHDAIFLIDIHGMIQFINPSALTMFGYTDEELVGKNINILMPSPHREKHDSYITSYLQTGIKKIIGRGLQQTAQRKDGSLFPVHLSVGEIRLKHTHLFAGLIMDLSIYQKLQREILEIPEREQQRIGEELHDGLGQQLTGLSMLAESLLNKASKPEHELADKLATGLHEALSQVRAMSRGLMPAQIYADGFVISLQEITENIEQQSRIPISLQIDETVNLADDDVATHLYRIVQESLNNAVKHAYASQIKVSLKKEQEHGLLEIIDDGIGIPLDLANSSGLGLNIMRHRCGMFDGEITINPAGQRGTQVRCRFPINPEKESS